MLAGLARNWWVLAVRGLFGIAFGILAFVWPGLTLGALVVVFGAYALVDGIFALVAAVRVAGAQGRWWPLLLESLVSIAAGVLTFVWPGITALALLFVIAAWAIVTGVFEIVAAVRLRKEISDEWALGLSGAASVIFGFWLLIFPGAGALAVVWLIGIYAIVFGVLLLMLAFRLRGMQEMAPAATRTALGT